MAITVVIPDNVHATLHHLAEEGDHFAVTLMAIINSLSAVDPAGADLATTAPVDPDTAAAAVGTGTKSARNDHKHHLGAASGIAAGLMSSADFTKLSGIATGATALALAATAPVDPDTAAAAIGSATTAAKADHKHHIAEATDSAAGLESAADKTKLDAVPANLALTPASLTAITAITVDAYGRVTSISGT